MTGKASSSLADVEAYLAKVPAQMRGALERLRAIIRAAAPEAEEAIVYGGPGFRLNGKGLVCYSASIAHCSFFPMDPPMLEALAPELAGFSTSKGTIRFTPDHPLPMDLVARIVKARAEQVAGARG